MSCVSKKLLKQLCKRSHVGSWGRDTGRLCLVQKPNSLVDRSPCEASLGHDQDAYAHPQVW